MTTGTIARWVRKQKKESDADKAAGRPNRVQRAAQRVIAQQKEKERKREEAADRIAKQNKLAKVVSGSVVASHPRKHLYGAGGILTKHPSTKTETGHHVVSAPILKGVVASKN